MENWRSRYRESAAEARSLVLAPNEEERLPLGGEACLYVLCDSSSLNMREIWLLATELYPSRPRCNGTPLAFLLKQWQARRVTDAGHHGLG